MTSAELGDEQLREDPTVNELQRRAAELLGQEAALFLPTATMANQIALRVLSRPGCLLIAQERTHCMIFEAGGPAVHSGLVMVGLPADNGRITPDQIRRGRRAERGRRAGERRRLREHSPQRRRARLAAGRARRVGRGRPRARHRRPPRRRATLQCGSQRAASPPRSTAGWRTRVTVCFSKGLGCPLGAVLASSRERIERAWREKFLFGGAMRQAGVVAAAALYALEHNIDRLAEDHARARRLAEGLAESGAPGRPRHRRDEFRRNPGPGRARRPGCSRPDPRAGRSRLRHAPGRAARGDVPGDRGRAHRRSARSDPARPRPGGPCRRLRPSSPSFGAN